MARLRATSDSKYVDEETRDFGLWIIFGARKDDTVDIHDVLTGREIMVEVPRFEAQQIIDTRRSYTEDILRILNKE